METTSTRTWKPTVAGILNIISGVVGLIVAVGMIMAMIMIGSTSDSWGYIPEFPFYTVPPFVPNILLIIAILLASVSMLALAGGIYALKRKRWGLALAGSISAIFASTPLLRMLPLGILATIFIAMAKDEFE